MSDNTGIGDTATVSGHRELKGALKVVKHHFIYAGLFSSAVNLLYLVPVLYMLAVYDRVLSSGSLATLGTLTAIMVFLLVALGGFEWVRSYILITASNKLDLTLRERVFNASLRQALFNPVSRNSSVPLNDLLGLRQFLTSQGVFGFFDAPWVPVYVGVMFAFHPLFGLIAFISAIVMLGLAYYTEISTSKKLKRAQAEAELSGIRIVSSLRNAEVIDAMGMAKAVTHRLHLKGDRILSLQSEASKQAGRLSATSKVYRIVMQSLTLGLGAYLFIQGEVSGGLVIAGSLLLGRALAPIDLIVASWKGFAVARGQYERLSNILTAFPKGEERMELPIPTGNLSVENIIVVPPNTRTVVLQGINFNLNAGEALGIIGPSASGKTSLARVVLGVWPTRSGKVRLDGADINTWDRHSLGPYIGYLPQDIELFDGTIADNIGRLGKKNPEKIVTAAKQAGIHEMILRQPDGYDTLIGAASGALSAGQRQRIGFARAIYGEPKLLVLDEPNSNLDEQGDRGLVSAVQRIKSAGCTILIVSHRPAVLSSVDKLLYLRNGKQVAFGPREQVLRGLTGLASEK